MDRIEQAEAILQRHRPGRYTLLGAGFAGVVFHDGAWVYKVHVPIAGGALGQSDHLAYLAARLDAFQGAQHLYPLRELSRHDGIYILVYPFEETEPVSEASEEEWCSFLAELFERRLITRSVSLASNFRRAGRVLKLIDYEIEPYDDNLFLNVVARAFIQLPHVRSRVSEMERFRRSTINAFDLPELAGFFDFTTAVAETIAARARQAAWRIRRGCEAASDTRLEPFREVELLLARETSDPTLTVPMDDVDPRAASFMALRHGYRLVRSRAVPPAVPELPTVGLGVSLSYQALVDPPQPVTLLVKACVQDAEHLEAAVEHIVTAMSGPERFAERVLALDVTATRGFPRQFSDTGTVERLLAEASLLLERGIVDRLVVSPSEPAEVRAVNSRWFDLDCGHTHTVKGVPVVPQLHAFDALRTDAVLQVDVDALVGVRDAQRHVLAEILAAFDDPRVVSVAFPVYRPAGEAFQPYFGFDGGGFVPEVRCCMLVRSRLEALRPLPNEALPNGLGRGWYRAVEARQRETGACSVRGGPSARFFIHPQNYRKAAPSTWPTLIDRVEQLAIPRLQEGHPEVRGALADWNLPARCEDVVVVVVIDDEAPSRVCRLLLDLEVQSCRSFGVILVDASGRRRGAWIAGASGFDRTRLTVIDRHGHMAKQAAVLEAVRGFVRRDDAVVCVLDAGDVLLRADLIDEALTRMRLYESDVLIGKELSASHLPRGGKHGHDLVAPRRAPETVADGLFAVRRFVLDALDLRDVRVKRSDDVGSNTFARLSRSHVWIDDPQILSLIVPSVELGRRPVCVDHFHLLRRRGPLSAAAGVELVAHLRRRPPKEPGAFSRGRKTFAPNLHRIEIDITYDCNLKCQSCNRSCTQAPTQAHMRLEQIREFVRESIALERRWEFINVLGGEPTLHPDFHDIVRVLLEDYVDAFSPDTVVQVTSNGFGPTVQRRLGELPRHPRLVVNRESFKETTRIPYFTPFNDAPVDDPAFVGAEYHKGCWVTSYCGIGLNHLGYFPCAVAGGIERVVGTGPRVRRLAEVDGAMAEQLDRYCRLCGNFKHYAASRGDFVPRSEKDVFETPVVSETWERLYAIRR